MDRHVSLIILIFLTVTSITIGGYNDVGSGHVLSQSEQDMTCGPRCLWALMQLTGVGKTDCDIEYICTIIGRPDLPPFIVPL